MVPQKKRPIIILEKLFPDGKNSQQKKKKNLSGVKGGFFSSLTSPISFHTILSHYIPVILVSFINMPSVLGFQAIGIFYFFFPECSSPSFFHGGLNFLIQISVQMLSTLNSFTRPSYIRWPSQIMFYIINLFIFITHHSVLIMLFIFFCFHYFC